MLPPRGRRALTTSNNVVITDKGSVLLACSGDVRGTLGGWELNLTTLNGVGSDVETLVEGDVLAVGSSGNGTGGGVVGQRGESLEGQSRVGSRARLDEGCGGRVDDVEDDGGVVRA